MNQEHPTPEEFFLNRFEVLQKQHWIFETFEGTGTLKFSGEMYFSGQWSGVVEASSQAESQLLVTEQAKIKGTIRVDRLLVAGEIIDADIEVQELYVFPTGKIFGRVKAQKASIEDGAVVQGQLQFKS